CCFLFCISSYVPRLVEPYARHTHCFDSTHPWGGVGGVFWDPPNRPPPGGGTPRTPRGPSGGVGGASGRGALDISGLPKLHRKTGFLVRPRAQLVRARGHEPVFSVCARVCARACAGVRAHALCTRRCTRCTRRCTQSGAQTPVSQPDYNSDRPGHCYVVVYTHDPPVGKSMLSEG